MEIKHIRHWGAISRWDQCMQGWVPESGLPGMRCRSATGGNGQIEDSSIKICYYQLLRVPSCAWHWQFAPGLMTSFGKGPKFYAFHVKPIIYPYKFQNIWKYHPLPISTRAATVNMFFCLLLSLQMRLNLPLSPAPCWPAQPRAVHALVSEDQTHFCNSNWDYCQPK